jgi:nitrate reductase beta subunit
MAVEWKIAFPLHPEYRTLPMVWYVPPLSPISAHANSGNIESSANGLPDVGSLRIPVRYLANLLTAGNEPPIVSALERMMAMRAWFRGKQLGNAPDAALLSSVGLDEATADDMHRYLAIANYEDRFVIPTAHREEAENAYQLRGGCGFTFGNGCDGIDAKAGLFGGKMGRRKVLPIRDMDDHA